MGITLTPHFIAFPSARACSSASASTFAGAGTCVGADAGVGVGIGVGAEEANIRSPPPTHAKNTINEMQFQI